MILKRILRTHQIETILQHRSKSPNLHPQTSESGDSASIIHQKGSDAL